MKHAKCGKEIKRVVVNETLMRTRVFNIMKQPGNKRWEAIEADTSAKGRAVKTSEEYLCGNCDRPLGYKEAMLFLGLTSAE